MHWFVPESCEQFWARSFCSSAQTWCRPRCQLPTCSPQTARTFAPRQSWGQNDSCNRVGRNVNNLLVRSTKFSTIFSSCVIGTQLNRVMAALHQCRAGGAWPQAVLVGVAHLVYFSFLMLVQYDLCLNPNSKHSGTLRFCTDQRIQDVKDNPGRMRKLKP